jgi:UDP-glucose 4-epimerase
MAVCLITGGAGFLGSHLAEGLLARGHAVRVLDDFSTGSLENLAAVENRVELFRGPVEDLALVRAAAAGAEFVFHLAPPKIAPEASASDPAAVGVGWVGTLHVLTAARDAGVRRVVYASSCQVYGQPGDSPRREEETPQPLSPYALAKLAGERQCVGFAGLYGLETVRLRYFSVYGPRQPVAGPYTATVAQLLHNMMAGRRPVVSGRLLGQLDLIYVDDAVHAAWLAATTPRAAGRVYNVGGGRPRTFLDVVAVLNGLLGTQLQPLLVFTGPGEGFSHLADTHRAEVDLGFCPAIDLDKGLRRCVEFSKAQTQRAAFLSQG